MEYTSADDPHQAYRVRIPLVPTYSAEILALPVDETGRYYVDAEHAVIYPIDPSYDFTFTYGNEHTRLNRCMARKKYDQERYDDAINERSEIFRITPVWTRLSTDFL